MISLKGIISIPFLKKSAFCGSDGKLRYRLCKQTIEEKDQLVAAYWVGDYCWQVTPDEEKIYRNFEFSTDGIQQAVEWLNSVVAEL